MIQPESPIQILGPPPAGPGPTAAGWRGMWRGREGAYGQYGQQAMLIGAQASGCHKYQGSAVRAWEWCMWKNQDGQVILWTSVIWTD